MGPVLRRWTFACTLSRLLQFQLTLRIKEQEKRLTLNEHDDDDEVAP
jgi:hypothetical protein